MNHDLQTLLDQAYTRYAVPDFIADDPICVPKSYTDPRDVEVAAFFTATIAWGNRKSIIASARKWMALMDNSPGAFVTDHQASDRRRLMHFVHRTFNGEDAMYFAEALQHVYRNFGSMEDCFLEGADMRARISAFRSRFFEIGGAGRTAKHLSDPMRGSAAKRLNMFLRWMVRPATEGIDFGLWRRIPTSALMVPLDVHTANVGRTLGLLQRTQDDWKAVEALTAELRHFDPHDPVKYDLALFGMGVNGDI